MEAIATMTSIANTMKNPEQFLGWQYPNVLNTGMVINTILFTSVGLFGYASYGDSVEANIMLNLPTDHVLTQIAQILIGLAMLLTFGLQFYAPTETLFAALGNLIPDNRMNLAQITIRSGICLFMGILTIIVPNLEPFIGLTGSIFLSTLGENGFILNCCL